MENYEKHNTYVVDPLVAGHHVLWETWQHMNEYSNECSLKIEKSKLIDYDCWTSKYDCGVVLTIDRCQFRLYLRNLQRSSDSVHILSATRQLIMQYKIADVVTITKRGPNGVDSLI